MSMNSVPTLAVIGGSGLYEMPGLVDTQVHDLDTPFGKPSAPIVVGTLEGQRLAFLARHGIGHHISPSEVNYRANVYALKSLGVERIVSISACGSLREDYAPGDVVVPDQLFDHTRGRARTFFGDGLVGHISVADPFCTELAAQAAEAATQAGGRTHQGGTYITIEGPRFSTRAESNTYRSWGMAIIGMTTAPEAFLAREAGMCYAVMAHVTDYDVWHVAEAPVTVEMVLRTLANNTLLAQRAVTTLARGLPSERSCACAESLRNALVTRADLVPAATRERLAPIVGRFLS
jgi:5'-methylthioadenosine phosphorylase